MWEKEFTFKWYGPKGGIPPHTSYPKTDARVIGICSILRSFSHIQKDELICTWNSERPNQPAKVLGLSNLGKTKQTPQTVGKQAQAD
jgi:hypothetical protein